MPWVRFDDQFPIHRKVKGLSDGAYRLHSEAIFWCARNLTDGVMHAEDVSELATVRRPHKFVPELEDRGIWHRSGHACSSTMCPASQGIPAGVDGWLIHDYWDYQPTKAKVEAERQAKAARQKRWLQAKSSKKDASRDASTNNRDASLDASQDASRDGNPAPPRPEGSGGGKAPERPASNASAPGGAGDRRRQAEARALAIASCPLCDDAGYAGAQLCDHDPQAPERAARGRSLVEAALRSRRSDPLQETS